MKRFIVILGLAISLIAGGPLLRADQDDHGHGHGNGHGNKHHGEDRDWEARQGYEYRTYYGPGHYPPGWSKGKKTGWGNCGMPPGQAKKYGCHTYVYEGRPYYYYQDEGGQIFVRRPVISVQGSVTIAP